MGGIHGDFGARQGQVRALYRNAAYRRPIPLSGATKAPSAPIRAGRARRVRANVQPAPLRRSNHPPMLSLVGTPCLQPIPGVAGGDARYPPATQALSFSAPTHFQTRTAANAKRQPSPKYPFNNFFLPAPSPPHSFPPPPYPSLSLLRRAIQPASVFPAFLSICRCIRSASAKFFSSPASHASPLSRETRLPVVFSRPVYQLLSLKVLQYPLHRSLEPAD